MKVSDERGEVEGGKPSWGAEVSAAFRAAEADKPEGKRVCYDPVLERFLGTGFTVVGRSPRPIWKLLTKLLFCYAERLTPGNPGYIVARTKYMDDYLKTCIDEGIEQLVILGAGYDSRAYRFDNLKGKTRVFEVDHPATQKLKIKKVEKAFGSLSDHVTYVAIDFDNEKLVDRMLESGYSTRLKTLFIWEGTTMLITAEGVEDTLAFVAENSGNGSSIIFDYILKSVLDGTCKFEEAEKWRRTLEKILEPYLFGIEEGTIGEYLSRWGFHDVADIGTDFLKGTLIDAVNPKRKVPRHYRIVHAKVRQ
ncbi:SAM-dependent methyltransferase [Chloroflexota bacterium]